METVYKSEAYMGGALGGYTALERHFSRMAGQGWMIDRIGSFAYRYRKAEPCGARFLVDLVPRSSVLGLLRGQDAQKLLSEYEDAGWELAAANSNLQVFRAGEGAHGPARASDGTRAGEFLKAAKTELAALLLSAALYLLTGAPMAGMGAEMFLSDSMTFLFIGWLVFLMGSGQLWMPGFGMLQYLRMRSTERDGLPMQESGYGYRRVSGLVFAACGVIFAMCVIAGAALEIVRGMSTLIIFLPLIPAAGLIAGLWARRQIDTGRRGRKAGILLITAAILAALVISMAGLAFVVRGIISKQESSAPDSLGNRPALTLSALGVSAPPYASAADINGSLAVPICYRYSEDSAQGHVETEVCRPVAQWIARGLYDRYTEDLEMFASFSYGSEREQRELAALSPEEAASWGADRGMSLSRPDRGVGVERLLLLKGKTVLRITLSGGGIDAEAAKSAVKGLW